MKEDFLYFVWQTYKLYPKQLATTDGESIIICLPGIRNTGGGPDFFNAVLEIEKQQWAGNVEMHIRSSDWYVHGHESDPNYDNVILHVVWEFDIPIFRKDGSQIPTLELRHCVTSRLLSEYESLVLYPRKKFINCESVVREVNAFVLDNWQERIYFERLYEKSQHIFDLLQASKNDWEKVLFCLLMKSFGLNMNGALFYEVAVYLDFAIIRRIQQDPVKLEAFLLGSVGLLSEEQHHDPYFKQLQSEYHYLCNKYGLDTQPNPIAPKFHGLRPNNFPTVRIAQLAMLLARQPGCFQRIIAENDIQFFHNFFSIAASRYWDNHYVFGKTSRKYRKRVTSRFIDLIIINTIVPLKFCHAKK